MERSPPDQHQGIMTQALLQHPPSLMVRDVDGEILLLDTATDQVHQLNATASLIWRMHHEGAGPAHIAEALTHAFEVDLASAQADVSETLRNLGGLGLLSEPLQDYAAS
jgi:Coenzyme PQQ synthesis protein D (PqqD)